MAPAHRAGRALEVLLIGDPLTRRGEGEEMRGFTPRAHNRPGNVVKSRMSVNPEC